LVMVVVEDRQKLIESPVLDVLLVEEYIQLLSIDLISKFHQLYFEKRRKSKRMKNWDLLNKYKKIKEEIHQFFFNKPEYMFGGIVTSIIWLSGDWHVIKSPILLWLYHIKTQIYINLIYFSLLFFTFISLSSSFFSFFETWVTSFRNNDTILTKKK